MWSKEDIPDTANVFMRVHHGWINGEHIRPGVFRDHGSGMSVDWDKYASPAGTLARAKVPEDNGVITMNVGRIRSEVELTVEHEPVQDGTIDPATGNLIPPNRAHSEVLGEKNTERRLKLTRIYSFAIRPSRASGA